VIPVSRSQVYRTVFDQQEKIEIEIYQGENAVARENVPLGDFLIEGLPPKPAHAVQVEVHFDFDLSGILTVTATEKDKGQQSSLVVNDAETGRLSSHDLNQSRNAIASLFDTFDFPSFDDDSEEE
jgi:molecular chaperone DnaK